MTSMDDVELRTAINFCIGFDKPSSETLKCKCKMLQRSSTTKKCCRVLANFLEFESLPIHPYSPDLAPMDFRVFQEIKGKL